MRLTKIIHAAFFTPTPNGWGLPMFFEGQPGVAKSSVIRAFAASVGVPCEVLSGAERGEGAFGAIPFPHETKKGGPVQMTYPAPDWAVAMSEVGRGLVFLDEITSNPPIIQAPCMGLMLDRRIGAQQLPRGVRVMAASNPPSIATNGFELSLPLCNRGGWVEWPAPTVDEHIAYMLGQASSHSGFSPVACAAEEARVMAEWGEAYARAVGLETSFLRALPQWKNQPPKVGSDKRAWPSDRTWEMATLALAGSIVHRLNAEDTDTFVSAFVGNAAYEAFGGFIERADLPDLGQLLDGKVAFSHDSRRLDRTAAVVNGAAALVSPKAAVNREARAEKLWEICADIGDAAMDVVVGPLAIMVRAQLMKGTRNKKGIALLAKIGPMLSAAGIDLNKVTELSV